MAYPSGSSKLGGGDFSGLVGKPFFDIRDFGAKVDGVTDDSPALRAAIEAARSEAGGVIYFPKGTTKLGGDTGGVIALGSAQQGQYVFQGEGSASKVLLYRMGSGRAINVAEAGSIIVRDLFFHGENDGLDSSPTWESTNIAFAFSNCWQLMFDNVIFAGIAASDVMMECASANITFRDCLFGACVAANYTVISAYNDVKSFKFINSRFIDYYWCDGILYNKISVLTNNKCWLQISAATSGALYGGSTIFLQHSTFDENTTENLVKLTGNGLNNVVIDNCGFNGGLGATTPVKLSSFHKAIVKDSWIGYNTIYGPWTSIEATDCETLEIDSLIHADQATDVEVLGTTKRLKLRDSIGVSVTNTAGALIDADQAMPSTASAAALAPLGLVTHVTGSTTITSIDDTNFKAGDVLTLILDSTAQISDGNNLKLAGNFTGSADRTLVLRFDGASFYEVSRSSN